MQSAGFVRPPEQMDAQPSSNPQEDYFLNSPSMWQSGQNESGTRRAPTVDFQNNNSAAAEAYCPVEGLARPPDMDAQLSNVPQDLDNIFHPVPTSAFGGHSENGTRAPALDFQSNTNAAEACLVEGFPRGVSGGSVPNIDVRSGNAHDAEIALNNQQQSGAPPCESDYITALFMDAAITSWDDLLPASPPISQHLNTGEHYNDHGPQDMCAPLHCNSYAIGGPEEGFSRPPEQMDAQPSSNPHEVYILNSPPMWQSGQNENGTRRAPAEDFQNNNSAAAEAYCPVEGLARPPDMDAQLSNVPQDLDNIFHPVPTSAFGGHSENGTRAPALDFQSNTNAAEACLVEGFPRGVSGGSVPNIDVRSGNAHDAEIALNNQQQSGAPPCESDYITALFMDAAITSWDDLLPASPPISQHLNTGEHYNDHGPQDMCAPLHCNSYAIGGPEEGFSRPPEQMDAQPSSNPHEVYILNSPPMWQSGQNENGTRRAPAEDFQNNNSAAAEAYCPVEGLARPPDMDAQLSNVPQDLDNIFHPVPTSAFGGHSENGTRAPALDFQSNTNAAEACLVEGFPRGVSGGSVPNIDVRSGNAHDAEIALNNQQQSGAPPCESDYITALFMDAAITSWDDLLPASPPISQHLNTGEHYNDHGPQDMCAPLHCNSYAIGGPEEGFSRPPEQMDAQPSSNPHEVYILNSPPMWQSGQNENGTRRAPAEDFQNNNSAAAEAYCPVEGLARPPDMDAQLSNVPQDLDNIFHPVPTSAFGGHSENGTRAPALDFQSNTNAAEACLVEGFPRGVSGGSVPNIDVRSGNAHDAEIALNNQQQSGAPPCGPRKWKRRRDTNWAAEETSVLVDCKEEAGREKGSRFCINRKPTWTNWNAISAEMMNKLGSSKTQKQCRVRWETLVRSYQDVRAYCTESNKNFSELTEDDRFELRLATTLSEDRWFEVIDQYYRPTPRKASTQKRDDLPGVGDGRRSASPQSFPRGWRHCSAPGNSYCRTQVAIPGFNNLRHQQRSTLVDLVNAAMSFRGDDWLHDFSIMEEMCDWLSVVQNRRSSEISFDVNALVRKKLVHISLRYGGVHLKFSRLRVYAKFVKKVAGKNPDFDTYRRIWNKSSMASIESLSLPQQITTLILSGCSQLAEADLGNLRRLRCLGITDCTNLEVVTGWEHLRELGMLTIMKCPSYRSYPRVQCVPSLKYYFLYGVRSNQLPSSLEPEVSQFLQLRRLEVWNNEQLEESGDLSMLKCLKVLCFWGCEALSTIRGLSELHSLTELNLSYCSALSWLPDIGHMKALVELDITDSGVEEIVGVEELVSLEILDCFGSKLKRLPDLHHLPRLRVIDLDKTPLAEDPDSIYFGNRRVGLNGGEKKRMEQDEFSEISDSEHNHSDCGDCWEPSSNSDYSIDD